MQTIKKFFSIETEKYQFEIYDFTTIVTALNVTFILFGFWWAPMLGIANCLLFVALNVKTHAHVNAYISQLALIILNTYFLTL